MSNHLAIATVTATLQRNLQAVVQADVEGARVTTVRPDGNGGGTPETGVNIFLYQVAPNAAWRNADLRTRFANDQMVKRPRAALDLFYLISFYGNETELEPQRLMGSVIRNLHSRAYLQQQMIEDTLTDSTFAYLSGSDLGDQTDLIKLLPLTYTTDELSRVWSVFFQVPYALSIGYQASIVIIESDDIPQQALPVRDRQFFTGTNQPQVDHVLNLAGPRRPLTLESTLLILGQRLKGDQTHIRIGDALITPSSQTNNQVELPLATVEAGVLHPGTQSLQVLQYRQSRNGHTQKLESNAAPFVLRPTVVDITTADLEDDGEDGFSGTLQVTVRPGLAPRQRAVLLLNERTTQTPAAYSFDASPINAATTTVSFSLREVKAGDYLLRIQIDGAESLLQVDEDDQSETYEQYVAPAVAIG